MCVCIEFFFNLLEAIHILFVTILKAIEPFITRPKFDNIYFARLVQSEKRLFETKYFVRILNYSVEKMVICLIVIRALYFSKSTNICVEYLVTVNT